MNEVPGTDAEQVFIEQCLSFLDESPTPFHAVEAMRWRLLNAGFEELSESQAWQTQQGKKYFVCRNDSSIIAFIHGRQDAEQAGIRMVGAHTDSPCLKVKPNPELCQQGYQQLGVEVYGGVLLNPWFDRDLSLAGRVSYQSSDGQLQSCLVDFKRPVAVIPSLAIHLDRGVNDKRSINSQTDIPPILSLAGESFDFRQLLAQELLQHQPDLGEIEVLDYEISCYDTQGAALVGLNGEFLASARLDNLISCYIGLQSLLTADGEQTCMLVCNDHEEVGSASACGAQGPMLSSVLERLWPNAEQRFCLIDRSMMISADNAHGVHPNFASRHDGKHGPMLNAGPVIKVNSNQRYATNSETSGIFKQLCRQVDEPVQTFVARTDMGCGSTIGPITASGIGVRTLDVGVPSFAMHSIRELAGRADCYALHRVFNGFFASAKV